MIHRQQEQTNIPSFFLLVSVPTVNDHLKFPLPVDRCGFWARPSGRTPCRSSFLEPFTTSMFS